MGTISKDISAALDVVHAKLDEIEQATGESLFILEDRTLERPFGWVFFYNTKKYAETWEMIYMLAGNSPLIVDRMNGDVHETGTAEPIEHYIAEYERSRAAH